MTIKRLWRQLIFFLIIFILSEIFLPKMLASLSYKAPFSFEPPTNLRAVDFIWDEINKKNLPFFVYLGDSTGVVPGNKFAETVYKVKPSIETYNLSLSGGSPVDLLGIMRGIKKSPDLTVLSLNPLFCNLYWQKKKPMRFASLLLDQFTEDEIKKYSNYKKPSFWRTISGLNIRYYRDIINYFVFGRHPRIILLDWLGLDQSLNMVTGEFHWPDRISQFEEKREEFKERWQIKPRKCKAVEYYQDLVHEASLKSKRVIAYISPVNWYLAQIYEIEKGISKASDELRESFKNINQEYSNTTFLDYSSLIANEYFIDFFHLDKEGSEILVQEILKNY